MIYRVMAAATGLFLLAACDDPKPTASEDRDVGAPSQMSGSSSQQGTVAKETPQNSMMMQSGAASGNAQTMQAPGIQPQEQRIGPRGENAAGTQPAPTTPSPTAPVPGQ